MTEKEPVVVKGAEILIVEDSAVQRRQISRTLEKAGYRVSQAKDGTEAWDKLRKHRPDLVVSDISMPNVDGYELCRRMKKDNGLKDLQVVLLTSLTYPEDVIQGLAAGATHYATKPYEEEFLIRTVASILKSPIVELRADSGGSLKIGYRGEDYDISSDRYQILSLLLATFENAVERNTLLESTQLQLRELNESLEGLVDERTSDLKEEIGERRQVEEELRQTNLRLTKALTERVRIEQDLRDLNEALERRVDERTGELRRANERLEAANRELEAFGYSVSHDLRAPLRAVDGFSGILVERYGPRLEPEAQRLLGLVRNGAGRMGQLIDDLLRFSRLSRQPLKLQSVIPTGLIRDVVLELQADANPKAEVTINELPTCQCDPTLLRHVFVNLLGNALKFTRGREDARIEVGLHPNGGAAAEQPVYYVRDNGAGFDMRYADKLFGVFQRLHNRDEFEGTGVGLAIVHRIISRYGGRIWAEAEVDKGATFYFTLGEVTAHDAP